MALVKLAIALLLASACTRPVSAPPELGEQRRVVGSFSKIDIAGALTVRAEIGAAVSVTISGEQAVLPKVHSETRDGTLRLFIDDAARPPTMPRATITLPALEALSASGASRISLAKLTGAKLAIDLSGATRIELLGAVDELSLHSSGSSETAADQLYAHTIRVDASGSGGARVRADRQVDAQLSGAYQLRIAGHPRTTERLSGAARIQQAD